MFSVAKQRLGDKIKEYRSRQESVRALTDGKMTLGDAVAAYQEKVRANVALKPRSKDYYHGLVDFINRSWPTLLGMDVRKVSERDCSEWLVRFQKQYAPSVVNNAISTLRSVFAEAVTSGARFGNPAANLSRMRIRAKQLELPSREQFLRFVEEIRTAGARQDCADLVRFLACSGLRLGEAKFVAWSDVLFDRRQLCVRGHPITGTKGGETVLSP